MENQEKVYFEVDVPYNNELMVKERKKNRRRSSIAVFAIAAIFVLLAILCLTTSNPSRAGAVFCGVGALVCVVIGIILFFTTKPNTKLDGRVIKYVFTENGLFIHQDNSANEKKNRTLEACLYRNAGGKQYISKVFEFNEKFQIRIFTGTYNGAPQYSFHVIPKDMLKSEDEMTAFVTFLKYKLSKDYVVKIKQLPEQVQ